MSHSNRIVICSVLVQHFVLYSEAQTLSGYRAVIVEENSWEASGDKTVLSLNDRGPM